MPSTFTGLVIFLALLAPGFTFLLIGERGLVAYRTRSALRETATIALASMLFNLVAFAICVIIINSTSWPPAPSLSRLVGEGKPYLQATYKSAGLWFLACLLLACVLAAVAAGLKNRTYQFRVLRSKAPIRWLFPPGGGNDQESGWWSVLIDRDLHPGMIRIVTCYLEDGSNVRGQLFRANGDATEGPERDVVLSAPLRIVESSGAKRELGTGSLVVSAGRMLYMHVAFSNEPGT